MKISKLPAAVMALLALAALPASGHAQLRVGGALARRSVFGRAVLPGELQLLHTSEFKGAHRVAISVFNVAFPSENHFVARTHNANSFMAQSTTAKMATHLEGVDRATQQAIADQAYATFVEELTAAGYEVVDAAGLAQAAPEYASWRPQPNFAQGRYGSYVAPTGRSVYFLQGDAAKRDTSGFMGQQMTAFRVLDRPQAFDRSPYIAHDGKIGVIAVTLIVDYGAYSSSGERKSFGKAKASFLPGVTIAAGNFGDQGSLLEYWGPNSGGFPAVALIQLPVRSEQDFGVVEGAEGSGDYTVRADPAKFRGAADEVAAAALGKLVGAMAGASASK